MENFIFMNHLIFTNIQIQRYQNKSKFKGGYSQK